MARISVDGDRLVLNHYCMRVSPAQRRGAIHLYGHSHGRLRGTSRCLDVGVDCWQFMPVGLHQIRERLAELPTLDPEYQEAEIE
jgi:calcineurin-like phosphoesterase family protein